MATFVPARGWGPERKRSALAITFDNLGEAGMLDRGEWHGPIGEHFTAAFVPRLIETLGDVRATYFIEASNVALYPQAIRAWHEAGHEVGVHAWRHEMWGRTPADRRQELLSRSMAAMRSLGIEPVGFRPPGGALPAEAWQEFETAGLLYCSDAGPAGIKQVGHMLSLPFEWPNVDAYVIEDLAAPLRVMLGAPEQAQDLNTWIATLDSSIDATIAEGGQRTIIFHPEFIGKSDEKLDVVRHLIHRAQAADMWIAPARNIATFAAHELGLQPHAAAA